MFAYDEYPLSFSSDTRLRARWIRPNIDHAVDYGMLFLVMILSVHDEMIVMIVIQRFAYGLSFVDISSFVHSSSYEPDLIDD